MIADLHSHSTCSDGWHEPVDLVDIQVSHGVELVALTDHDTLAGVAAARDRALRHGVGHVVAVEVTAGPRAAMNHLLAHGIRADDVGLSTLLAGNLQIWRAETLIVLDRLRQAGLAVPDDPCFDDPGTLCMPNTLARKVVRAGLAEHDDVWAEIRRARAHVPDSVFDGLPGPAEVADAVHGAGGLVVWAHPGQSESREVMMAARQHFDAIEVHTPRHSEAEIAELTALCASEGIATTTGRDFHGHIDRHYKRPPVDLDPAYLAALGDRVTWPAWTEVDGFAS